MTTHMIRLRFFAPARAMVMTENDPWTSLCGTSDEMRLDIRGASS
jgi:hypothetical protein